MLASLFGIALAHGHPAAAPALPLPAGEDGAVCVLEADACERADHAWAPVRRPFLGSGFGPWETDCPVEIAEPVLISLLTEPDGRWLRSSLDESPAPRGHLDARDLGRDRALADRDAHERPSAPVLAKDQRVERIACVAPAHVTPPAAACPRPAGPADDSLGDVFRDRLWRPPRA